MKRIITLALCFSMALSVISGICYAKEFSDVDSSHWAREYISKLSDDGVINGYVDGTFKPSKSVTRAEFLKLIITESILSSPVREHYKEAAPTLFNDWWKGYTVIAKNYIPYAYTDEDITEPITRLEVANILNSFAIKDSLYTVDEDGRAIFDNNADAKVNSFTDVNEGIGESGKIVLSNISNQGLLIGYDDGSFKPGNYMTRAEVATIIYRYHNMRGGNNG